MTTPKKMSEERLKVYETQWRRADGDTFVSETDMGDILAHIAFQAEEIEALKAEMTANRSWRKDYVQTVHDIFANDIARGYVTKDKTFAVALLKRALAPVDSFLKPKASAHSKET